MREKLLDLMKSEGLKSSQLADMLGINPAGISHILAGRNKPGFDLLQKILRRFPRINPDWLLLDTGPMYRDAEEPVATLNEKKPEPAPQSTAGHPAQTNDLFAPVRSADSAAAPDRATVAENLRLPKTETPKTGSGTNAVTRIVIFYDDGSFESYLPTMR